MMRAPIASAMARVASVEPLSTTTTSSTRPRTDAITAPIFRSSLRVRM